MLQATHSRETRDGAREIKFLVTPQIGQSVLEWARPRLGPDPHAGGEDGDEYRTTSIYFDTDDFAVYRRRGSYRRSKYRIRRYGDADVAFLERKMRTASLLSKRRSLVALGDLARLGDDAAPGGDWAGAWFAQRLEKRQLAPVGQVSYHRHARVGVGPFGPSRLTFDNDIQVQPSSGIHFDAPKGIAVIENATIIEMKFCIETPPVFKELLDAFGLVPSAVSKYRLSIDALRQAGLRTGAAKMDLQSLVAPLDLDERGSVNA